MKGQLSEHVPKETDFGRKICRKNRFAEETLVYVGLSAFVSILTTDCAE